MGWSMRLLFLSPSRSCRPDEPRTLLQSPRCLSPVTFVQRYSCYLLAFRLCATKVLLIRNTSTAHVSFLRAIIEKTVSWGENMEVPPESDDDDGDDEDDDDENSNDKEVDKIEGDGGGSPSENAASNNLDDMADGFVDDDFLYSDDDDDDEQYNKEKRGSCPGKGVALLTYLAGSSPGSVMASNMACDVDDSVTGPSKKVGAPAPSAPRREHMQAEVRR